MMRIALYHNLPSGGAKRTLMESAKRLSTRHRVDAYTLSCAEHDFGDLRPWVHHHQVFPFQPSKLFGSPLGRLNQVSRMADLRRLRSLTRQIAQQIDGIGYDVVFVHPCQFEQSPSILRYVRTPTVYYCQEPRRSSYEAMPKRPYDDDANRRRRLFNVVDPLPHLYRRLARRTDQVNTRSADRVFVNSMFMAETVNRLYGISATVAYHGVDVAQFRPLGIEKSHIVLSVGSLTPLKGFDFLVRAMARLDAATCPRLVIASNFQNADERLFIELLAKRHGVQLSLLCAIDDDALVTLYNEALLVAYSAIREPFGLVPLEAMACGTPVVSVNEGGVAESVIAGHTGLLVDRDQEQFALAIARLAADSDLAARLGRNGREHVLQHWTWEHAAAGLERSLESAAGLPSVVPAAAAYAH
jgi:glycosyltransferase involved in cell wall biosynthesis